MSAISSPSAIGHDWESACPSENKIPDEWLQDESNPDTSDASVIQGRQQDRVKFPYSSFSYNAGLSHKKYFNNHLPSQNISTINKPYIFRYFNQNNFDSSIFHPQNYQSHPNFSTSKYVWLPIRRQPIIMYPMIHLPPYTSG